MTVINVGPDPIFNVGLGGEYRSDGPNPSVFWEHGIHQHLVPFVFPGERASVGGWWKEGVSDDAGPEAPVASDMPYWVFEQLPVLVTWTDGRGLRWQRTRKEGTSTVAGGRVTVVS